MKQIQKAKRHRGSVGGWRELPAADPRDLDIVHVHRSVRHAAVLVPAAYGPAATTPPRRSPGGSRLWPAPWSC
jgi:hypothetical protein